MKKPHILTVFLMLMFAIASFTVQADAVEVYPGGAYVPDVPSFVGYAGSKIVVKLDPSMRRDGMGTYYNLHVKHKVHIFKR